MDSRTETQMDLEIQRHSDSVKEMLTEMKTLRQRATDFLRQRATVIHLPRGLKILKHSDLKIPMLMDSEILKH